MFNGAELPSVWLLYHWCVFHDTLLVVGEAAFDGAALVPGASSGGTQPSAWLLSRRRAFNKTSRPVGESAIKIPRSALGGAQPSSSMKLSPVGVSPMRRLRSCQYLVPARATSI